MEKPVFNSSQILSGLIAAETAIYNELAAKVGEDAQKAVKSIRQHAYISGAFGLGVILPGVDLLALVTNTWAMYARINHALGISLGKNALKSIASAVGTNVISIIPGIALGAVGGSLLKLVPGLGTVGGMAVSGATSYALTTVMGWIYLKAITTLVVSNKTVDEENLKDLAKQVSKDKEFIKSVYKAAKSESKEQKSHMVDNDNEDEAEFNSEH
jgi:uncharacterized protein (DUF697 family)